MKTSVSPSVGPSNSGSPSTSSSMYEEQNVKTSLSMYALAIDPSGLALFLKRFFNVPSHCSIGYIQPYCTGPLSSASSGRWTAPSHQRRQEGRSSQACIGLVGSLVSGVRRHVQKYFCYTAPERSPQALQLLHIDQDAQVLLSSQVSFFVKGHVKNEFSS